MIEDILKEISKYIGNERLYNKVVIVPLFMEIVSRISGDPELKKYTMKLYAISRDIRAIEEFISVYTKTKSIEKAVERAMYKLRPRYAGKNKK